MGKRNYFSSDKRQREIKKAKKSEEKRLRKLSRRQGRNEDSDPEITPVDDADSEVDSDATEVGAPKDEE
jgi:hypothetical protein